MTAFDTRAGVEWMARDQCLRLLADEVVGRLAIVVGGAPAVFPVNYALDGEDLVFRTAPGTKLSFGPRSRACFEIDQFDRATRSGWSVVVAGRLEEQVESGSAESLRVRSLPVEPWAPGPKAHWVRLVSDRVTGRRVVPVLR